MSDKARWYPYLDQPRYQHLYKESKPPIIRLDQNLPGLRWEQKPCTAEHDWQDVRLHPWISRWARAREVTLQKTKQSGAMRERWWFDGCPKFRVKRAQLASTMTRNRDRIDLSYLGQVTSKIQRTVCKLYARHNRPIKHMPLNAILGASSMFCRVQRFGSTNSPPQVALVILLTWTCKRFAYAIRNIDQTNWSRMLRKTVIVPEILRHLSAKIITQKTQHWRIRSATSSRIALSSLIAHDLVLEKNMRARTYR